MEKAVRPKWDFDGVSESSFRRIHEHGAIITLDAKWRFLTEDTSTEWLEAVNRGGKRMRLPSNWKVALEFVGYTSGTGLFKYTYQGERMREAIKEIDAWEKSNKDERAEYERLKQKFAGA